VGQKVSSQVSPEAFQRTGVSLRDTLRGEQEGRERSARSSHLTTSGVKEEMTLARLSFSRRRLDRKSKSRQHSPQEAGGTPSLGKGSSPTPEPNVLRMVSCF
jgi:hypothetical protein